MSLHGTPQTVAHQAPLSMGVLQARMLEWVACLSPGYRGVLKQEIQEYKKYKNQALLERISERRINCETPEEAETSQENRRTPEVSSVSWANSAGKREAMLAALETEVGG